MSARKAKARRQKLARALLGEPDPLPNSIRLYLRHVHDIVLSWKERGVDHECHIPHADNYRAVLKQLATKLGLKVRTVRRRMLRDEIPSIIVRLNHEGRLSPSKETLALYQEIKEEFQ